MSNEDNVDKIVVDGEEHNVADLTPEQQYYVKQLRDLNAKTTQAQFQVDQLNAGSEFFKSALLQSVKAQAEEASE